MSEEIVATGNYSPIGAVVRSDHENYRVQIGDKNLLLRRNIDFGRIPKAAKASLYKSGAERMGCIDSGYVSENIALMCTALGLNTVPRMSMDSEILRTELKPDADTDLLLNHPVGYAPK